MSWAIRRKGAWKPWAFSLVEILVVVAILMLLMALAVPAFQSATQGSALSRGGQLIADQLILARQEATGRNRDVQIRLVWLTNEPAGYKAIQLWTTTATNSAAFEPFARMAQLPEGVIIASNATYSPLITASTIPKTNATFPGRGMLTFCGFRFRPEGGTDLTFNSTNNFLTVVYARDAGTSVTPANYCAVQIDPVTGRVKTYRP